MKAHRWTGAMLALVPWASLACSQILSIEDAHVDPSLSGGTGGSASVTAGTSPTMSLGNHENGGEPTVNGGSPSELSAAGMTAGTEPKGGSTGTGSAGAPPQQEDLCERYCDQVTRVCKGKYEQYRTFDQCIRVCKQLPAGEMGDKDTNTVGCRLRQAEQAETEPFLYCKSAGPLGEGKCGSDCISYCGLMQSACTPASTAGNLELSYYESSQACLSACAALPTNPDGPTSYSSSATAEPTSFIGNNVFCRTYHVAAALGEDSPDEHCPHAMGGDPCTD